MADQQQLDFADEGEPAEEQEQSMRDALESAIEQSEVGEGEPAGEPPSDPPPAAEPEGEPAGESAAAAEGEPPAAEPAAEPEGTKAPASWSPAARETWKDLPAAAQAEVAKREQQTQQALQESAKARHFSNTFGDMASRYAGFISANSGNPLQEVEGLLQTASVMQSGTQVQKAQMAAQLIKNFSIDIQTLDDVLVGEAPQNQVPDEVQNRLNQLEGYFQQQQTVQRNQQLQKQQAMNAEVEQFVASHEFANDLRGVMADFMDIADRQGAKITLDEAYTRAIGTRPDIQQLLANRQIGQANHQNVTDARRAAVSVPQVGGQGGAKKPPATMREALLDAWDGE
jgi:hypothetical protein